MLADTIDTCGCALLDPILPSHELASLTRSIERLSTTQAQERSLYAVRRLAQVVPQARELAGSPALLRMLQPFLGPRPRLVRSLLFDKLPGANWLVPWHQDLTIAVRSRVETPGFGPWSVKDGVVHVQPPRRILESMLTVRMHLDAATPENGPLRIVPGSHRHGVLTDPQQITALRRELGERTILQAAGGVFLMRPLLLHASSKASRPSHRRIIHLEFAREELPNGLEWTDA